MRSVTQQVRVLLYLVPGMYRYMWTALVVLFPVLIHTRTAVQVRSSSLFSRKSLIPCGYQRRCCPPTWCSVHAVCCVRVLVPAAASVRRHLRFVGGHYDTNFIPGTSYMILYEYCFVHHSPTSSSIAVVSYHII